MAVHREEGRFVVRIELSAEFGEDYATTTATPGWRRGGPGSSLGW